MRIRTAVLLSCLCLAWASQAKADNLVYQGEAGVGSGKHIVFIANDHEYRSEQTCPLLAKILAKHFGFKCTVLFGINEDGCIEPGAQNVPGLESLKDADLLVFFTRFMKLPDAQADLLVDYFERGGAVVGIRTSTHCFNGQTGKWSKLNYNYQGEDYLGGLGEQIFGNTWHQERGQSHYGANHVMGSRITPVPTAAALPILRGVGPIHAYSGAYESKPPSGAEPLLQVQVLNTFGPSDDIHQEKPIVNAGWTRDSYTAPSGTKKEARVVYTSFGASEDMLDKNARRFMINACLWALGLEDKISADLDVSIVGGYAPTPYSGGAYYYEGVKPVELSGWDSQIMPESAKIAGVTDRRTMARFSRVLENRPQLKARLAEKYPDLYGPNAEPAK